MQPNVSSWIRERDFSGKNSYATAMVFGTKDRIETNRSKKLPFCFALKQCHFPQAHKPARTYGYTRRSLLGRCFSGVKIWSKNDDTKEINRYYTVILLPDVSYISKLYFDLKTRRNMSKNDKDNRVKSYKFFLIFVLTQPLLDCDLIKPLFISSDIEHVVEVSTYFSAGGKIHSNACVEVSHRGDTQHHMLERRRYA